MRYAGTRRYRASDDTKRQRKTEKDGERHGGTEIEKGRERKRQEQEERGRKEERKRDRRQERKEERQIEGKKEKERRRTSLF